MVIIRCARMGTVKRPFYHIVVTDSRNCRDGRHIERVGYHNPIASGAEPPLFLNMGRIEHWLSKGARVSPTVSDLLKGYRKSQVAA